MFCPSRQRLRVFIITFPDHLYFSNFSGFRPALDTPLPYFGTALDPFAGPPGTFVFDITKKLLGIYTYSTIPTKF